MNTIISHSVSILDIHNVAYPILLQVHSQLYHLFHKYTEAQTLESIFTLATLGDLIGILNM